MAASPASTASTRTSRSQRIVLVLILTGQLMAVLDASIVNVAIPTIRLDLHATGADLQLRWVKSRFESDRRYQPHPVDPRIPAESETADEVDV